MANSDLTIRIAERLVGDNCPVLVVGEVGVNHEGRIDEARKLIRQSSELGLEAVKFQTYKAARLVTHRAMKYWHLSKTDHPGQRQIDTFRHLDGLPRHAYKELVEYGKELGVLVFSTPFDEEAVDLLYEAGVPALKIASGDITYHRLLKKAGWTGLPIMLSTGASTDDEILESLDVIKSSGNNKIILLHCILDYPTEENSVNLGCIPRYRGRFEYLTGFSDHTLGYDAPVLAVSQGACVIEKHCTGLKWMEVAGEASKSPDHNFMSMDDIGELANRVRSCDKGHHVSNVSKEKRGSMLGSANPARPLVSERAAYIGARRSIVAKTDLPEGAVISEEHIAEKRPATGLAPTSRNIGRIVGKKLSRAVEEDELITDDCLACLPGVVEGPHLPAPRDSVVAPGGEERPVVTGGVRK